MRLIADFALDHHLLDGLTILGLLFGVLGSLYLAYDLLDRKYGILRRLTEALTLAMLTVPFASLIALDFATTATGDNQGLAPTSSRAWFLFVALAWTVGMLAGLVQGFWIPVPRSRPAKVFSARGCLNAWPIWVIGTLILGGIVYWGLRALGSPAADSASGQIIFLSEAVMLPLLMISGGFSPFVRWWANRLPKNTLGVIGVFLILFGFLLAMAQPVASILDLPIH